MALPYNGTISIGAVNTELEGGSTNKSLVNLSQQVGKTSPHGLQEFYGYTNKRVTFSNYYSAGVGLSYSGTVTIVGGTINFSAAAIAYSTSTVTTSINVNGNTRSVSKSGSSGTAYSTSFQLGPGTWSYSFSVSGSSGQGSINTSWA